MLSQEVLEELVQKNIAYCQIGKNANYIPALATVDPHQLGVAYYDLATKKLVSAGDADVRFAIESISKVPVLMLAILQNGLDDVFGKVNVESSGFAFNSILNMEITDSGRPSNPFINAGAILTTSLIQGASREEKFQAILTFMQKIMNDPEITLDTEIYQSEDRTGDINRSLAYYMKGNQILSGDVTDTLDTYFKQCSVLVTAKSLAHLGALLANGGVAPWSGERILSAQEAKYIKALMTTAGLYNESGSFALHIGVPAKSGVGGGLMCAVPKKCGIGFFSPPLDKDGNSVASMNLAHDIIELEQLDIFE